MTYKVGDTIRFTKTGITAKIIRIGLDPNFPHEVEERYFLKISPDDEELVVGEGNCVVECSMPISSFNAGGPAEVEKIS